MDWFLGFAVSSSMLLAPVIASAVVIYWSGPASVLNPTLAMTITVISLMLLLMVMQRLAPAMWGAAGEPGLIVRRAFVLMLPASVIAAVWWQVSPATGVRTVGLAFPVLCLALLVVLVFHFLYLYFSYTDCSETRDYLNNRTPDDALMSFYELLKSESNGEERREHLKAAVQHLAPFRRSTYVVEAEDGDDKGGWRWPSSGEPRKLSDLGSDISKGMQSLFHGDLAVEPAVRESVFLRSPEQEDAKDVVACCAIEQQAASVAPGEKRVEDRAEKPYVAHRILRFEDGWFLESGRPVALSSEDVATLREAGLLL